MRELQNPSLYQPSAFVACFLVWKAQQVILATDIRNVFALTNSKLQTFIFRRRHLPPPAASSFQSLSTQAEPGKQLFSFDECYPAANSKQAFAKESRFPFAQDGYSISIYLMRLSSFRLAC